MELYQLRAFLAVAEEEHLTRASERLNASQPAVSAQIRALEDEFGAPLFSRTPKGMLLTEVGRALLSQARLTLDAAERLAHTAAGLKTELLGQARLGLNNEPHRLRVSEFLSHMRRHHPRVELHLNQMGSPCVLEDIRVGKLDGGFVYDNILDTAPGVTAMPIEDVEMAIIGPTSWRERLTGADCRDLAELPWVWFPEGCPFQRLLVETMDSLGRSVRKVMVADQDATLRTLVASGCGLSLIRRDDAVEAEALGEVCLWSGRPLVLRLAFMYRAARHDDPLLRALREALREVWKLPGKSRR